MIRLITWDSDPLSADELAVVEQAIGELPDDYRHFLLTSNGGRFVEDAVAFLSPTDGELYYVRQFDVVEAAFPPCVYAPSIKGRMLKLIRIAGEQDSPILMRIDGDAAGAIYHWTYRLEEYWEAEETGQAHLPDEESLKEIAPSFTAFINGLLPVADDESPAIEDRERSAENYAMYGDHCFEEAKAFFDAMSLRALNARWPKKDPYNRPLIFYAANWSQIRIAQYLIERGVDRREALTHCTNSFEISKILIDAGATDDELRELLFVAASDMHATSVPEENHKIILHLLERGVRPNFADRKVAKAWHDSMDQIFGKKILRFLISAIDFPPKIADMMRKRLAQPQMN